MEKEKARRNTRFSAKIRDEKSGETAFFVMKSASFVSVRKRCGHTRFILQEVLLFRML